MQRLDKILSEAGVASRKALKDMIKAGRVKVNGVVATTPEQKLDALSDEIQVDGAPIRPRRPLVLMLNKPAGYVCSTDDPRDLTVMTLLSAPYQGLGLMPVGRLDKQTEGLLLFTNDGALAHWILSPKHRVEKVYEAEHTGEATLADVQAFAAGLTLRDETVCLPAVLEPLGPGKSRVHVCEGKYHQVRRMMAARGLHVAYLCRVQEGGLCLGALASGVLRELTEADLKSLLL